MKIVKEANTMTIFLMKKLYIDNAEQVEKELFDAVENIPDDIDNIVIDASDLEYISSMGLRVLLKFNKAVNKLSSIINVSRGVYDVLDTTGFTVIMDVKRKLRKVSLENCQLIGSGAHGKVYKLDEESIIKIYYDNSTLPVIDKERMNAKEAFIRDVPTAMAFDTVITDEGYGVIFENAGGSTIGSFILNNPEKLREYSGKFAALLKLLNSKDADPDIYLDTKSVYLERIQKAAGYFTAEENEQLIKLLKSVPDGKGMVHGDFSTNNIMVQPNGELIIIDMADITRGSALFDIGSLFFATWLAEMFKGFDWMEQEADPAAEELADNFRNIVLESFFDTTDKEKLASLREICNAISLLRMTALIGTMPSGSDETANTIVRILRKHLFPNTERYCELLAKI